MGKNRVEVIAVHGLAGAHDGHMQHHITGNDQVGTGNFRQLTGINVVVFGSCVILQRYNRRFLPGKLHHMVSTGEESQAESDGDFCAEINCQQHKDRAGKTQNPQHRRMDVKIVSVLFVHRSSP